MSKSRHGFIFLFVFLAFSTIFLSTSVMASNSFNVSVKSATSVMIIGSIVNTSTSDVISGINVSATVSSNFNSTVTGANGLFNFNVTAPTTAGEYTVTVTNNASLPNKTFSIFVSNITGGSIGFLGGKFPPFTNGTTFTINVTLLNGTSPIANYQPSVKVYQANGRNVSWTVTPVNSSLASNSSQLTNSTGSIAYNITIPTNAAVGEYGISVDFGKVFTFVRVGSNVQIAVNTLTTSDEIISSVSPGSVVNVLAKLRTTDGDPVTSATVTAVITYPSGSTTNISLSAHPSSSGFYNNTFTTSSAIGEYKVKVGALKSGSDITGSTTFSAKSFQVRIEPVKNSLFFEWGGKSAFKPGENISLNVITVNSSSADVINWDSCGVSNYTFLGVTFVNGTNTTLGPKSVVYSQDQYLPSVSVCKINFAAPSSSGTYNLKVNVTLGSENQTGDGFFSVSNHFMKVTPVLDVGGFEGFHQAFAPGTNVTIQLKAVNVSGNSEVNKQNITSHTITRIVPLEFTSGASEITTISQTSYNGVNGVVDPNITFVMPSSILGPALIEVKATVNSSAGTSYLAETVTGTTFVIINYLEGFLGPQKSSSLPTHEGEGSGGFNSDVQCSGTQQFSGIIRDVNTSTAAQGATIVGITQAREEETGKDVSSFLSITNTSSSDSNGLVGVNITFSTDSYSFSGNYFVVFNASYKGNFAGVPSFFTCRTLNMGQPLIKAKGSDQQFSWQLSPTSIVNLTLTNVAHMNGSIVSNASILMVRQIFSFNPTTGTMQVLTNNTPMQINFTANSTANNASLFLHPQNYSLGGSALTKWPNGFYDIRPRVVSNLGTDTGFGGFMIVAFDAFAEFSFSQQYAAGSNQSIIIRAATNVSYNATHNFTVTMGRPWEGVLQTAGNVTASIMSDGWNNSVHTGNFSLYSQSNQGGPFERWNVTFTVPNGLRKGGSMLTVRVVSNATGINGETVDVPLFVTVSKFNVVLPFEEYIGNPSSSQMDGSFIIADGMYPASFNNQEAAMGRNASAHGWNLTWINSVYGINSTSGRVCVKNTFNSTRMTQQGQQNIPINATAGATGSRILVIDRSPSTTYNTVIMNISNTTLILNTSSLSTRSIGGQLYLWDIKDCSFFTVANVSTGAIQNQGSYISNNNGGSGSTNANISIPYVVISGSTRQSGVPVTIKSLAKQDNRGFGFEGKLPQNNYTFKGDNTNADGVAFVSVNVTVSGRMLAFWSTTIGGESDSADMSTGTTLEIKGFSTSAQSVTPLTNGVVTLTNGSADNSSWSAFPRNIWNFNGSSPESSDSGFVSNGVTDTWYIGYNSSNYMVIMNITPLNSQLFSTTFINGTITPGNTSTTLKIGEWNNGTAANNYSKTVLFYTHATGSPNRYSVSTSTENITALMCAQGFEKPNGVPVENATINVSVTDWSSFPPSIKYMDVFRISDGSRGNSTHPVVTSPSGCALTRIGPGGLGSWPSASAGKPPVFLEGTITKTTGGSEFVYIGDVFRP